MRKSLVYSVVALSILAVLVGTVSSASAATLTIGVDAGMSADYRVARTGTTYNRTLIYVSGKTSPTIRLHVSDFDTDGSPVATNNYYADPTKLTSSPMFYWVVSIGASIGDSVFSDHPSAAVVRNSLDMTVAGATRHVNHANGSSAGFASIDLYYDTVTGIMVKGNIESSGGNWYNLTLISTNAWSSATSAGFGDLLNTTTLALIGGVGIVALVAGFLIGGHGKRKR